MTLTIQADRHPPRPFAQTGDGARVFSPLPELRNWSLVQFLSQNRSCLQPIAARNLHHEKAHDAPPYFTMTIVAHIVVPALFIVEKLWAPSLWIHAAIWLPLTLVLTLGLLPMVKGAIIGLQWANRMHGFGGAADDSQ